MADDPRCSFCNLSTSERDLVGQTFCKDGVSVHQYCLYFAAGLYQRGEEKEGIHGFLLADIRKEVSRASRLTCRFCRHKGAATGCTVGSCRQMCHAPCGIGGGFLFRHKGRFEAFCPTHRPAQKPALVTASLSKSDSCLLCLNGVNDTRHDPLSILVCPVCETGFHRKCLQQRAWSTGGVMFRCPACANQDQFREEMIRMGLEIPEKDDVTETECQAVKCLCPDGRSFYTRMSKYRMKTCRGCEKELGHMVCVKGHLCQDCVSSATSTVSTSSAPCLLANGHTRVGVANPTEDTHTLKCDCIICRAREMTPDSPTPSVGPSLHSPSPVTQPTQLIPPVLTSPVTSVHPPPPPSSQMPPSSPLTHQPHPHPPPPPSSQMPPSSPLTHQPHPHPPPPSSQMPPSSPLTHQPHPHPPPPSSQMPPSSPLTHQPRPHQATLHSPILSQRSTSITSLRVEPPTPLFSLSPRLPPHPSLSPALSQDLYSTSPITPMRVEPPTPLSSLSPLLPHHPSISPVLPPHPSLSPLIRPHPSLSPLVPTHPSLSPALPPSLSPVLLSPSFTLAISPHSSITPPSGGPLFLLTPPSVHHHHMMKMMASSHHRMWSRVQQTTPPVTWPRPPLSNLPTSPPPPICPRHSIGTHHSPMGLCSAHHPSPLPSAQDSQFTLTSTVSPPHNEASFDSSSVCSYFEYVDVPLPPDSVDPLLHDDRKGQRSADNRAWQSRRSTGNETLLDPHTISTNGTLESKTVSTNRALNPYTISTNRLCSVSSLKSTNGTLDICTMSTNGTLGSKLVSTNGTVQLQPIAPSAEAESGNKESRSCESKLSRKRGTSSRPSACGETKTSKSLQHKSQSENDRITSEFLQSRGLAHKLPQIILNRVT